MRTLLVSLILTVFSLTGASLASASSQDCVGPLGGQRLTPRAFMESLAKPLPRDRVFYRWQSPSGKAALLKAGHATPQLMTEFMQRKSAMGGGLYLAVNDTFEQYGPTVIEVRVAKGTPVLNTRDARTERAMDAYFGRGQWSWEWATDKFNPRVMVRFDPEDYYVVKKVPGLKMTFHEVDLKKVPSDKLIHWVWHTEDSFYIDGMYYDQAEEAKLQKYRAELWEELVRRSQTTEPELLEGDSDFLFLKESRFEE